LEELSRRFVAYFRFCSLFRDESRILRVALNMSGSENRTQSNTAWNHCMSLAVKRIVRQCADAPIFPRHISTSALRCAKKDKKDKGKAKPVVKKSTRKGEVEPPKKARLSPEAEVKIMIRRATALSQRNPSKMTMGEAIRVLRVCHQCFPRNIFNTMYF